MEGESHRPTSIGNWLVTLLLTSIPIVNIIALFVWAFSSGTEISKANYAKAALIWLLIAILFYLAIGVSTVDPY